LAVVCIVKTLIKINRKQDLINKKRCRQILRHTKIRQYYDIFVEKENIKFNSKKYILAVDMNRAALLLQTLLFYAPDITVKLFH